MTARPVLLYRATCPKCRFLSKVVVLAGLGRINRIPIDSAAGIYMLERRGLPNTKAVLLWTRGTACGWRTLPHAVRLGLTPVRYETAPMGVSVRKAPHSDM